MKSAPHISVVFGVLAFIAADPIWARDDVNDISSRRLTVADDPNMSYFLLDPKSEEAPPGGYGLLVVLPGGNGGPIYHSFVKRIYKHSIGDDFLVVQPLAVRWSPQQDIVWPTRNDELPDARFSTEDFVAAVVEAVQEQQRIDPNRIFLLSWSSSGPAAYAISLQEDSPIVGSYIAMSVFKPEKLGSLNRAAGHAYFIDHCPQDDVCPFRMASEARRMLAAAGAKVQLNTYAGGHGWQGDVFLRIARGIRWLQNPQLIAAAEAGEPDEPVDRSSANQILYEDFERIEQWRQGGRVEGVEYLWDRDHAYQGLASVLLKKTANRSFPIAQWYRAAPCSGSVKLDVSAWVKAEDAHKAVIDLQFRSAAGKNLGHQWAVYIGAREASDPPANHNWKRYSGTVDVPTGTESMIIGLQLYGPGAVWFDALDIRRQ